MTVPPSLRRSEETTEDLLFPSLEGLSPKEREIADHLVAAFLAFRRFRRGGTATLTTGAGPDDTTFLFVAR